MRGKDKRTGGTALLFPTQGSLGTNTQTDGWDGMGQGTHVCSVHAKKMHHALPLCSVEKGKASCRCGTTKHNGMTRGCQTNGGLPLDDFCCPRESHGTKVRWARLKWIGAKRGGRKDGNGMDAPAVSHTHRSVLSLTHEGRKKKIPFLSLSLSRMHAWRGERANIRRINGQSEDGWWSCLCVQCTVLLREWAGEGRQTRWQSGLMGNFGHLCKGGGGRPKRGT